MGTDYSRNLVRGQVLMPTSNANTIQIDRSTAGLEDLFSSPTEKFISFSHPVTCWNRVFKQNGGKT